MDWMIPWLVHLSGVPTLSDDGEGNTVYVVIQRDTPPYIRSESTELTEFLLQGALNPDLVKWLSS